MTRKGSAAREELMRELEDILFQERLQAVNAHLPLSSVKPAPSTASPSPPQPHNVDTLLQEAYADREKLAQEGVLLSPSALQNALGVSRQAISQRLKSGKLFFVDGAGRARYYPAFFADPALDQQALREVTHALGDIPGASKWMFFTTPRRSLYGKTPLEILAGARSASSPAIDISAVMRAAAAYAES